MAKLSDSTNIDWVQLQEQGSDPATPSSGYGRVYAKADGLYYVDDAGTVTGPLGISAMTQLSEVLLASPQATIDFTSISGSYRHLKIIAQWRSSVVAAADIGIMQFNGDTGTNYYRQQYEMYATTNTVSETLGGITALSGSNVPGSTATANLAGYAEILIPNYAQTTFLKTCNSLVFGPRGTATNEQRMFRTSTWWNNTAAINRVTFTLNSGGNFATGTLISLYGIN